LKQQLKIVLINTKFTKRRLSLTDLNWSEEHQENVVHNKTQAQNEKNAFIYECQIMNKECSNGTLHSKKIAEINSGRTNEMVVIIVSEDSEAKIQRLNYFTAIIRN
jgi:hypothetical protein